MQDDNLEHVKAATSAAVVAAVIVTMLFFTPTILDACSSISSGGVFSPVQGACQRLAARLPPQAELRAEAGDGQATLRWSWDEGGERIRAQGWQYRWQVEAGPDGGWTDIPGGSAHEGYIVDGLENGLAHSFQVRSWGSSGVGVPSGEARIVPRAAQNGGPACLTCPTCPACPNCPDCPDTAGGKEGVKGTEDGCPDKGEDCESGSVATTITGNTISVDNINVFGIGGVAAEEGKGWCPLPLPGWKLPPYCPEGGGGCTCVIENGDGKRLLGEVHFEHDLDYLSREERKSLDRTIEKITAQPDETILLEGYASFPGDATYNLNLAERRIQSVAGHIGATVCKEGWRFIQAIYGESHIYRGTVGVVEQSRRGDPKNRAVRIYACGNSCDDMVRSATPYENPCTSQNGP